MNARWGWAAAHVVNVVERGPDAGEQAGAEPQEGRRCVERQLPPVLDDPGQQPLHNAEGFTSRRGVGRQEALKEKNGVDRRPLGDRLGQVSQADQHQQDEWHRCQQRVEGRRWRGKGVVSSAA